MVALSAFAIILAEIVLAIGKRDDCNAQVQFRSTPFLSNEVWLTCALNVRTQLAKLTT